MGAVDFIQGCIFILGAVFFALIATALAVATESLKEQRETDPDVGNFEVGVGYFMTLVAIVCILAMLDAGIKQFR